MILIYITFFIIGIAMFILMKKLSLSIRLTIAMGVFLALCIIATVWIVKVGDKPLPGAVTIYPEKVVGAPKDIITK
jgi:uncharacterized membrane protein